jgi:hypothetical protein
LRASSADASDLIPKSQPSVATAGVSQDGRAPSMPPWFETPDSLKRAVLLTMGAEERRITREAAR